LSGSTAIKERTCRRTIGDGTPVEHLAHVEPCCGNACCRTWVTLQEDSMLRNATDLRNLVIAARDGELGKVKDLYFDDERWVIRHLEVDTGGWLTGRRVLISPHAVRGMDWINNRMHVSLTKEQVENSPPIDSHKPVSRQEEEMLYAHYGYPYYWSGPGVWGTGAIPMAPGLAAPPTGQPVAPTTTATELENRRAMERARPGEGRLRSCNEVVRYDIEAVDGKIGHVDDFMFEDDSWRIRYLIVATRDWLPGKRVLIGVDWVDRVSWPDEKVFVDVTRERVKSSPEYSETLTRDYETILHKHYGRVGYWPA
jgi:uncharacterized protein YrrD